MGVYQSLTPNAAIDYPQAPLMGKPEVSSDQPAAGGSRQND